MGSQIPIVEPGSIYTKLRLSREGLEAIRKINTPIAAIRMVIPIRYRIRTVLLTRLRDRKAVERRYLFDGWYWTTAYWV